MRRLIILWTLVLTHFTFSQKLEGIATYPDGKKIPYTYYDLGQFPPKLTVSASPLAFGGQFGYAFGLNVTAFFRFKNGHVIDLTGWTPYGRSNTHGAKDAPSGVPTTTYYADAHYNLRFASVKKMKQRAVHVYAEHHKESIKSFTVDLPNLTTHDFYFTGGASYLSGYFDASTDVSDPAYSRGQISTAAALRIDAGVTHARLKYMAVNAPRTRNKTRQYITRGRSYILFSYVPDISYHIYAVPAGTSGYVKYSGTIPYDIRANKILVRIGSEYRPTSGTIPLYLGWEAGTAMGIQTQKAGYLENTQKFYLLLKIGLDFCTKVKQLP